MTCQAAREALPPVPDSVETVFCLLASQAPLTGRQLRDATGLPRRTLYSALKRLQDTGMLRKQVSLRDSRQTFFWLDHDPVPAQHAAT